jgi:prepilin-type N-terminal cleavage/methylation domain-containing protein
MTNDKLQIKKGFTLIELLVVISIIGVLAAMATISYTSSQKQARDTVRKSDLTQYKTLLEAFANVENGLYPSHTSPVAANSICGASELNQASCPVDPKNGTSPYGYYYVSDGSGLITATKYALYASLENVANTNWGVCSTGKVFSKNGTPSMADCP